MRQNGDELILSVNTSALIVHQVLVQSDLLHDLNLGLGRFGIDFHRGFLSFGVFQFVLGLFLTPRIKRRQSKFVDSLARDEY
jgi:hypothetical protein